MHYFFSLSLTASFLILSASFSLSTHADDRKQKLDFDDAVVEGLNKKPLDSLSQLNQNRKRNATHLYQKKTNFDAENQISVVEAGYAQ